MALVFEIKGNKKMDKAQFGQYLSVEDLKIEGPFPINGLLVWTLIRKDHSTTSTVLEYDGKDNYSVVFDCLASYDDYRFLPYLLDSLSLFLTDKHYMVPDPNNFNPDIMRFLNPYELCNEDWVHERIGDAIAYAKCVMSLHSPYNIEMPLDSMWYVTESVLNEYGVDLHSSTPRIYGYIQYLLRNKKLPFHENPQAVAGSFVPEEEITVEVPEHVSIGTVQSWQTDGSITTESFCSQDVALLYNIGQRYLAGAHVDGVVLNDIGTIFQEGIGLEKNVDMALDWYRDAIKNGDHWFAPSSLGDIYRKGTSSQGVQLQKAIDAYQQGNDPYAWFRIGQSFEEGWVSEPNLAEALRWYEKAAAQGHHLAVKRLETGAL